MSEQEKPEIVSISEGHPEPKRPPAKEVAPEVREAIGNALGKDAADLDIVQLPPKPASPIKQAALTGAIGFFVGAVVNSTLQPAIAWALKIKKFNKSNVIDDAAIMGAFGTVFGWYTAKHQAKEYGLKVDNVKLQHKVDRLEAEKAAPAKSFVKDVVASKEAADLPQISR